MSASVDAGSCMFDSHSCSSMMLGHGGLVGHHEVPKSMGGAEDGKLLLLCPNHHYRQHSLIRYIAEQMVAGHKLATVAFWHFTVPERNAAMIAYLAWDAAGRPEVFWPTPAAR